MFSQNYIKTINLGLVEPFPLISGLDVERQYGVGIMNNGPNTIYVQFERERCNDITQGWPIFAGTTLFMDNFNPSQTLWGIATVAPQIGFANTKIILWEGKGK